MNWRCLLKLFLSVLVFTALGIYIQNRILNVSDVTNKQYSFSTNSCQNIVFSKTSIGPFPSKNRSSCSCDGYDLIVKNVPAEELEDLQRRRSEEYRQYQLRMKTNIDPLLLAPSNSPLQYPLHGFTVAPLQQSTIPGLALHARKRGLYKVSLSVKSGVLSVKDVSDGDQVDGRGQSEMNIKSSNLTQVNKLLSRVTYTSTVYHVKTKDMVHFLFENHEAIFPIIIKRPSVPILYDPGNDINSQVTITTKTFLRYYELDVLIKSIRQFYPKIKIIVADDSMQPENVTGENIDHYIMPPARGWFAGRNLAISQVTTKYFLWVDDDFIFMNNTRIERFVEIMEKVPELDVLGGAVGNNQFGFRLQYDEGDEDEGGCLRRFQRRNHQFLPGFKDCFFVDGVVNFFLARTDAVRRVGFDPFYQRVAHTEFFIDGLGELLIASCKGMSVGHQANTKKGKYRSFRFPGKQDGKHKLAHHYFKNHLRCIKY